MICKNFLGTQKLYSNMAKELKDLIDVSLPFLKQLILNLAVCGYNQFTFIAEMHCWLKLTGKGFKMKCHLNPSSFTLHATNPRWPLQSYSQNNPQNIVDRIQILSNFRVKSSLERYRSRRHNSKNGPIVVLSTIT